MKDRVAICGSKRCTGKESHCLKVADYVEKNVPRGTIGCPDCLHVLRWVNKKNKTHASVTKRSVPKSIMHFEWNGE